MKLDPDTVVNPGTTPNAIAALASAGADGWETTGITFSAPGATVLVMKRMR